MDACLSTTELLERILKFVDNKTLLSAQRVSRRFQAVIKGSLPLQRKLFLAPATWTQMLNTADGEEEDLLNWRIPYHDRPINPLFPNVKRPDLERSYMVNPLLSKTFRYGSDRKWGNVWTRYLGADGPWADKIESVFQMCVYQPMPEVVEFEVAMEDPDNVLPLAARWPPLRVKVPGFDAKGPRAFGRLLDEAMQLADEESRGAELNMWGSELIHVGVARSLKELRDQLSAKI